MPSLNRWMRRATPFLAPVAAAAGSNLFGRAVGLEDSPARDLTAGAVAMSLGGNPLANRFFRRHLIPQVATATAADALMRRNMGFSSFDPQSVQQHMQLRLQDSLSQELSPIVAPWLQHLPAPTFSPQPLENSELIRRIRYPQQQPFSAAAAPGGN